jgi:EF hand domain-containing protein
MRHRNCFLSFLLVSLALAAPARLVAAPPSQARAQSKAPKAAEKPKPNPQSAPKEAPAPADNGEKNPYLERFKQLDANGDGYVSRAEWPLEEAKFRTVDRNEDGRLSRIELLTPNVLRHDPRFQPMRGLYTPRYGYPRERYRGGVGYTPLEYRTDFENLWSPRASPQDQRRFEFLDRNRDERLSRNEWNGSSATFDRIDRNRDGILSPGEWP